MRFLAILLLLLSMTAGPAAADLLLTEVYYDHVGIDGAYEWVEIFNAGPAPVDLSGYVLAAGGTDYGWTSAPLQGVVGSCETFVIGGLSAPENGAPVLDQVFDFDPDIQNAGTTADGVALFAPGSDPLVDCPVDAVIYGGSNDNGLRDETCGVGAVDVGDAPNGSSIERTTAAGAWVIQAAPDPNAVGFISNCDPVPAKDRSWGALKSGYPDQN